MRLKRVYKIMLSMLLIVIITLVIVSIYNKLTGYTKLYEVHDDNTNDEPIYIDHMSEFDIKDSNYIEDYYDRYMAYKEKHSDYSENNSTGKTLSAFKNKLFLYIRKRYPLNPSI